MVEANLNDSNQATASKRARQIKPRDDPKLLAEICRLHFREEKKYKKIIEILERRGVKGVRDEPTVTRLVSVAREHGLIYFDIDESFALRGEPVHRDARSLQQCFDLNRALVIDVPAYGELASEPLSNDIKDNELVMRADDQLHTVLANHAGLLLQNQLMAGDHIAVAGGRCVNQAVKMIGRDPPSLGNIMVTSMGGRLWSHKWWRSDASSMRPLDPDDSAFILFLAFQNEPGTMFEQVGHSVFATSREQAEAIMKDNCMFQPRGMWYENIQPNRAIVGIGVVDPESGHRAVRKYEGSGLVQELTDRHLEKVKPQLEEAIATAEESGSYFGDVANRFFATLPLPHEVNKLPIDEYNRIYEKLIRQLNDLNERMVVVEWSHIRSIPAVTAIAGGSFKLGALWTILFAGLQHRGQRLIKTLVTDATTAHGLLSAMDTYRGLDVSIQQWYEKLVRRLFLDPE